MARPRLELHDLLKQFVDNVYYQPPTNIHLQYPCIVYARDGSSVDRANNELYRHAQRYQVTVIDRNPDTQLVGGIEALKFSTFEDSFAVDDLNHYVFTLFF